MRVRSTDVGDSPDLVLDRFAHHVERAHRVDEAEWAAFLAGAIVGHHHDNGVIEHAGLLQRVEQPSEVLVEVVEHRGVCASESRKQAALVAGVRLPRLHTDVAVGQDGVTGNDAELDLRGESIGPCLVPALGEDVAVVVNQLNGRLVWCVTGARRQEHVPRIVRRGGEVTGNVANRVVDEVFGEVVSRSMVAGGGDV